MDALKSFLQGRWVAGAGNEVVLVDPATEEPIATASTGDLDLKGALAWGRDKGGKSLRAMTFGERGALLLRMSKVLHEVRDDLIAVSIKNGGTTRGDAKFDIDGAISTLAFYARLGEQLGDKRFLVEGAGEQLLRGPRYVGYHVKVPRRGVAVHVNAFNFPAWGLCEKAATALLAGVPVVTKPATSTALLAVKLVEVLVEKAQMPEGALQLVTGSVGDLLADLDPQDVVAFTGSADTGAKLRMNDGVVKKSVRINVEADSLNSAVLGEDVQPGSDVWHLFIRHVALEMTQKAGQKCTATRRIFVPKARIDDVQQALVERLSAVKVGDPSTEGVEVGPLATKSQLADAKAGVQKLVEGGAKIVLGGDVAKDVIGQRQPGKGYYFAPTLLRHDAPRTATHVHAHEVFGPVATLMPYDSVQDAGALVAQGEGSLVASLYSDDKEATHALLLELAPFSGRVVVASSKVADQMIGTGAVLPASIHGGPGRAGGGEELGGERGLSFYMQRTAVQGDRAALDRFFGVTEKK